MSLWARKPVRILVVVLALLLIAVVAVRLLLPADKIRAMAQNQAREKLGREVTIGDVSISVLGGLGIKLNDVAVANPDGFAGAPLATVPALDLKLAFRPLLKKEIQVERLVVDGPSLNLVVRADGTNNFTFPTTEKSPATADSGDRTAGGAVISIPHLSVQDARLSYADARSQGMSRMQMDDLNLDFSLGSLAGGDLAIEGTAQTPALVLESSQPLPSIEVTADLDMTWRADPAAVEIHSLETRFNGVRARGQGHLALGEGTPTGTLELQLPEQALTRLATLAPPELAAKVSRDQKGGLVSAALDVVFTGQADAPVRTAGTAKARGLDLALAQPFLPTEQDATIGGHADLDLEFSLPAPDLAQLRYTGTATLQGVSFRQPQLMDQLQNLDAVLKITPERFTVESSTARFASGTFALQGSLRDPLPYFLPPELQQGLEMKTPHLEFTLRTKRLDVDKLLPAASPSTGSTTDPSHQATPPKTISVEFPDITGNGTIAADSLFYMKMPFTDLTGRLQIRDRVLDCRDLQGGLYAGRLAGQVSIDLKDLNDPAYSGRYQMTSMQVSPFLARFVDLHNVLTGTAGLQGSFAAKGRDPQAIQRTLTLAADGNLSSGMLHTSGATHDALSTLANQLGQNLDQEQALRDLRTHLVVQEGKIGLENMQARLSGLGDISLGGTLAFTGELDYQGQLLLSREATAKLFTGGVLGELGKLMDKARPERLALPLAVGGTRSAPRVKIDLGSVASELEKQAVKTQGRKLEDAARKGLENLLKKEN
ncbi:hypothetical protein CSB20_09085 [bacterium DOLZORAL124_64_63]|nr:MAG: hypothetical protein CSB20_09085 [bacterium DOLZORAL124_64_63]